jgi:hypothetical protein
MAVKGLLSWRMSVSGRLARQRQNAPAAVHVAASVPSWRTLSYRLMHTIGSLEKAAETLGSEDPESVGFGAHPVQRSSSISRAVAMCENFVQILAMAQHGSHFSPPMSECELLLFAASLLTCRFLHSCNRLSAFLPRLRVSRNVGYMNVVDV